MATDYSKRLRRLRDRRRSGSTFETAFLEAAGLLQEEAYEKRAKGSALRYGLGIMQEVDPKSTQISVEEGERVRAQLEAGLPGQGHIATFDYQGSVPLNVHIRGASDIDLLVLHAGFVTYDVLGPAAHTYRPVQLNRQTTMASLRTACETVLVARFFGADVDTNGAKSVALEGGSLRRKVDVVPAHWDDTAAYQATQAKHDRQIYVYDKHEFELIENRPFMHMKRINDKDAITLGGAKKVIRMLKNLRKDASQEIELNSYDIASIVWNFPDADLIQPTYLDGALIAVAQIHLRHMLSNRLQTDLLWVPDGSRKVMDKVSKYAELEKLAGEVDQLASDIAGEINPAGRILGSSVRDTLFTVRV